LHDAFGGGGSLRWQRQGGLIKSANTVILDVLGYEFASDDRGEAERKIRRRLRHYGLGPYRQDRIDLLRRLKDEIQGEILRGGRSRYFVGSHRPPYAAIEDLDVERMTEDLAESYPNVPRKEIDAFVPFAVYLYYLR
jgi:uncharacterized protein (DUF433 family)